MTEIETQAARSGRRAGGPGAHPQLPRVRRPRHPRAWTPANGDPGDHPARARRPTAARPDRPGPPGPSRGRRSWGPRRGRACAREVERAGPPRAPPGPGPLGVLRAGRRGPRSVLGGRGRGPDAAQPYRLRGRGEDDLHDELRVERDGPDGGRAGDAPRGAVRSASKAPLTHAFPTPEAMASVPESFYRETVRAGYRGAYLDRRSPARSPRATLDLEALGAATPEELSDDELEARLLSAPGRRAVRRGAHHDDARAGTPG